MNKILDFFAESKIHDYKLEAVLVDYAVNQIKMIFKDLNCLDCDFVITNLISFFISHEEPWGEGRYVVSSGVEIEKEVYIIEIQLNSGDKCVVKCYA